MKLRLFATAAIVCMAFVSPAFSGEDDKTVSASEVRTALSDLKLKFKEEKDDEDKTVFVVTGKDDVQSTIYQYGGKGDTGTSLGIRTVFQSEEEVSLAPINAYNRDERFAKAYLDEERDIILEDDLDVSAGASKDVVQRFIGNFLDSIPGFVEQVSE